MNKVTFSLRPNPDGRLVKTPEAMYYPVPRDPARAALTLLVERTLLEKPEFRHLSVFGPPTVEYRQKWVHIADSMKRLPDYRVIAI